MIYCPQCGTPNKPNSKFCKNCAALLMPSTDVRCPICGTLNPQGAASCTNCGTRLTTFSTAPSDKTTPADTPENITPFTPPELEQEEADSAPNESVTPPPTRPSFSRASSEWLKRIQKTSPAETPAPPATPATPPPPAVEPSKPDVPDWLREIQVEAEKQAATERQIANEKEVAAERAALEPRADTEIIAPSKPALSEIKLTGDDYDYSDIGGEVTDEMKAALEAKAASVQSVDDEIALARKLLGLEVEQEIVSLPDTSLVAEPVAQIEIPKAQEPVAEIEIPKVQETIERVETMPTPPQVETPVAFETPRVESEPIAPIVAEPVAQIETLAPSKPALSEIKLTGDDYDYSDIGGEVTDEMKAALEAKAASVQSVDDEIALARKLLGLEVEQEIVAEPIAQIEIPKVQETIERVETMPTPPQVETPVAFETPRVESEPIAPIVAEPVAQIETPAPSKPALSEIKLTGDDYDYSDIGGEVTDEMKAALEAKAASVQSVDDEIALARKLLGLEVEQEIVAEPVAEIEIPKAQEPVAEIEIPKVQETIERVETIPTPPQVETPVAFESPRVESEPIAPIVAEPVAQMETPAPSKPALSEIKLTGDDYDYSDIGGEVTDEMKAALEAKAASVQSVDDEIALARKLLGLDVETTPVAETVTAKPVAQETPPVLQVPPETAEGLPDWLPASTGATTAAVAADTFANVVQDKAEQESAPAAVLETPAAEALPIETPPVAEIAPQAAAAEISVPEPIAPTVQEPTAVETAAEIPAPEIPPEPPARVLAGAPILDSGALPEWLREFAPQDLGQVEAMADLAQDGTMPEWVKDLEPTAGAVGTSALLSRLPALEDHERGDLPDWLREPVEPPQPEPASIPVTPEPALADTPLELPDWFTNAQPIGAAGRDPFEVIETSGPLAGVSGILPLAVAITEPHTLTTPTPTRSDGGRIFQTLLAEPLTPGARVRAAEKSKALVTANHLLYLLILLAALVPLLLPLDQAGLGLDASKSATALFYDQLHNVPANGSVLLAFEYSPGDAVEIDPAARAIVNDLAARRVNVIAVSSNPNGATIAQDILQRAQKNNSEFVFVNVGYIAGNEAGLRALASGWLEANRRDVNGATWASSPLANRVTGMDDLALSVIFTGDENNLKAWMEQVYPRVKSPIVAATSAKLEPQARNYVNAKQLKASLRGLTGAAELELLSNTAGQAVKTVDALSFVSLLLAGIIIAANVMMLLKRKR